MALIIAHQVISRKRYTKKNLKNLCVELTLEKVLWAWD